MCGIIGVFGDKEASKLTYLGLHTLQHRGQEAAGILSTNGREFFRHVGYGKVRDVLTDDLMKDLKGYCAIGHNRYSTTGESHIRNAQPVIVNSSKYGPFALVHNGNISNYKELKIEMEKDGSIFQTNVDSEIVCHLIAKSKQNTFEGALKDALTQIKGGYSIIVLTKSKMFAVRDPHGIRPLVKGKKEDAIILASESNVFDMVDAKYDGDLEPGVIYSAMSAYGNIVSYPIATIKKKTKSSFCIFEHVYFAKPNSKFDEASVYQSRYNMGKLLAESDNIEADLVVPIPDSANVAAMAYAEQSGIPYQQAILRSNYSDRTFIEPTQKIRNFGIKLKYNVIKELIENKRVILVDDSIVRGNTMNKIVTMIKDSGAKEIHIRIASAPITHPCFYGIDMPTKKELVASKDSVEEIRKKIEATSLKYLSIPDMIRATGKQGGFCLACFTGDYLV